MSGRVYTHKFDWDEARRLRAEGLSYNKIADQLGVTPAAIRFACDARAYARAKTYTVEWQRRARCTECGARCTRLTLSSVPRCRKCAVAAAATSVRPTSLQCVTCREWLPDLSFPVNRAEPARRGRHGQCSACGTSARVAYRASNKVPCEDCGALVEGKGRSDSRTDKRTGVRVQLDPNRPYLCHPCGCKRAAARLRAERANSRVAA